MTRVALLAGLSALVSCGPGLTFNKSDLSQEGILERASHIFIGVIEKHEHQFWLNLPVPRDQKNYWTILRRQVRVENVIRGTEPRQVIQVYEFFWIGGATGNWNYTQDGGRYVFPVRVENGRYHVTQDWRRSVWPVGSGHHDRLPLDDSAPLLERLSLLNFWEGPGKSPAFGASLYGIDRLSLWRHVKLFRGLARHPERDVRVGACGWLVSLQLALDECLDSMPASDRHLLNRHYNALSVESMIVRSRGGVGWAAKRWSELTRFEKTRSDDIDMLRILTTINDRELRARFCRDFQRRFPNDADHGCPTDRPPPATIVTDAGDIPLAGAWPAQ